MLEFFRGATVYLELTVRDASSPYELTTPDTGCTIDILDENEAKEVSAGAMTEASTGVYYYNWTTSATQTKGVYTARGFAIMATPTTYSVDEIQFRVK